LGDREGPGITHQWTPPSLLPWLIPWFGILLLLVMVPENRGGSAWWIWLPLAGIVAVMQNLGWALGTFPSELQGLVESALIALAFGHAAIWLLSDRLGRRHRVLTCLSAVLVLGCVSGLTFFLVQQEWGEGLLPALMMLVPLGMAVLVGAIALGIAGWRCWRRCGAVRLSLTVAIAVVLLWLLIALPFVVMGMVMSGGAVPWGEVVGVLLVLSGLHLATLLPFLALSFCNAFFRQRLEVLLNLDHEMPPLIEPSPIIHPV
jgi:hypothetical protein